MKKLAELQISYEYLATILHLPPDVKIRAIEQTVEDRLYQTFLVIVEGDPCPPVNEGARPVRVKVSELQSVHK